MSDTSQLDWIYHQERLNTEMLKQRISVFESLGAKLSKEGDQWCYLLGEDIRSGIVGYGDKPYQAMVNFCDSFGIY